MNRTILMGNLTSDPQIKTTGEIKIARMLVAVERMKDKTDFIKCVAFGRLADYIEKYAKSGSKVVIDGRLTTSTYDDKNGVKQYTYEVYTEEISIIRKSNSQKQENIEDVEPAKDDLPF